MIRNILKGLFWVLILALLILPLGLIYRISEAEMKEYEPAPAPVIRQISIGPPKQAVRSNLQLYVILSGRFTSKEVAFMELDYREPYDIRWIAGYGDEIQVGQLLGYYHGEEILSTVDGIIEEIRTGDSNSYLMVRTFAPLVLECQVDDTVLQSLAQFADSLTLVDGTVVTVVHVSRAQNPDGTTTIQLSLSREGDAYGGSLNNIAVYLGTSYPQVLTLPVSCVYQRTPGEDQPWYVREVTKDGFLIGERQVEVTYSTEDIVVIKGVEEGQWFDSGYKAVMDGDDG